MLTLYCSWCESVDDRNVFFRTVKLFQVISNFYKKLQRSRVYINKLQDTLLLFDYCFCLKMSYFPKYYFFARSLYSSYKINFCSQFRISLEIFVSLTSREYKKVGFRHRQSFITKTCIFNRSRDLSSKIKNIFKIQVVEEIFKEKDDFFKRRNLKSDFVVLKHVSKIWYTKYSLFVKF